MAISEVSPARSSTGDVRFESILFGRPAEAAGAEQPDFFADLNLDQVLEAMIVGREPYDLAPYFSSPLHDVADVRYRHEVLRDLEDPRVLDAVRAFAKGIESMRRHLRQADEVRHALQKQAWQLMATLAYCDAVRSLAGELDGCELGSDGFKALRAYLREYVAAERFAGIDAEGRALRDALASVRYTVLIDGMRVSVDRFHDEPDYGAEVERAFAKFQQHAARSYLVRLPDHADMDRVEAQILDRVARLEPHLFARLARFCEGQAEYVDERVARFDREVQFYLAFLALIEPLKAAGLPFCHPRVAVRRERIFAQDTFDLALALKLVRDGERVVGNELRLEAPERMFVVTGPNNGGKTTFARTFGQLHHLAALGLPVPGSEAQLFLPDRIFTHFEREEEIGTLRGKFEEELVRVHAILEQATASSVIVMNESFGSTSLRDARVVGTEVMRRILGIGAVGVYVTFVDEIASLDEATVSVVAQVAPDNPAERTMKVIRVPADGLAYAAAIAEMYGLAYSRLTRRIGS